MTIYPLKFSVLGFELTGFGIMMMVGFLAAGWVMQRELRRRHLNPEYAADVIVAGVIGGIIGAKVWYAALNGDPATLLSRAGLVWYGGLIGGAGAVILQGWWKKIPARFTLELAAPALALGHALGRVGCFLVQDDYGVPTALPWGMRFPEGLPPTTAAELTRLGVVVPPETLPGQVLAVHPTQLYEVAALLAIFAILWRMRRGPHAVGWLFAMYLILAGIERFLVEFVRAKDDRVLSGFTLAQAASIGAILLGMWLAARWRRGDGLSLVPDGPLKPHAAG